MSHLRGTGRNSVIVLNHAVLQLRRHCHDHMVEVRIEESAFWNIMAEGRVVMIAGQHVVRVVDESW